MVAAVVVAVVAVVGLWYSNVQTRQANEQAQQASKQAQQANAQARDDRALAKDGQITSRYTAAVGNLGEDKTDVRLGGIYALQRIMQDSPRDHPTIAHILAAYVRTHAAKPPAKGQDVPADVHAALTVLTTRNTTRDDDYFLLDLHAAKLPNITLAPTASAGALSNAVLTAVDLTDADLTGADLTDAVLTAVDLPGADLTGAYLTDARLTAADLTDAVLPDAYLTHARLRGANLTGANLTGANLTGADLTGADLRGADLRGADLTDADLTDALNLTWEQVESAITDEDTELPASLR
ncbi:pentapeptide repeat-containing protein [Streptomyces sp. NBC_00654]|uniref:pentapeptide repeat-containing protein n=1 Tax=Streptomyces sp. NBC_00654 TaxID=2975799 RepID=UPI002251590D|nr:pentapeptide repeat-containing protein [Streptomyces sp. NBC_00654]MCX4971092.1 pentapeptide repeat-containing protein [Streptomyces sp. NBC_00654]